MGVGGAEAAATPRGGREVALTRLHPDGYVALFAANCAGAERFTFTTSGTRGAVGVVGRRRRAPGDAALWIGM